MQLEERKYLFDIKRAADAIYRFCQGKQFQQYKSDELLRSAVERQFEIIGEALSKLAKKSMLRETEYAHDFERR